MLLTGNLSYYLISHFFLQISAFNGSHTFATFILVLLKILLNIFSFFLCLTGCSKVLFFSHVFVTFSSCTAMTDN